MPAIEFTFDFDEIVFEALEDALERAPKTIQATVDGPIMTRLNDTLLTQLRTAPGPPRYPLKWRSEKQRRFVMAKLRRENNLPYKRKSPGLVDGWELETAFEVDSGGISLIHPWDGIRFVVGPLGSDVRQPMFPHWFDADALLESAAGDAEDILVQSWFAILDTPIGFD